MFGCFWKSLLVSALLVTCSAQHAESSAVIRPVDSLLGLYDTGAAPYVHDVSFDVNMSTGFSAIQNVELRVVGGHGLGSATPLGAGLPQKIPGVVSVELFNDQGVTAARGGNLLPLNTNLDSTFSLTRGKPYTSPPDYSPLLDGNTSLNASFQPPVLIAIYGQVTNPTVTVNAAALIVTGDALGQLRGDYDGDGVVYVDDYRLWRNTFGSTVEPGTGADGNGDGKVDVADYSIWRSGLGASVRPTNGSLAGDFDYNGRVDADDHDYWKSQFGNHVAPFSGADGSGNGLIDVPDFVVWRDQLGQSLPGATAASLETVPEPAAFCLIAIAVGLLPVLHRIRLER